MTKTPSGAVKSRVRNAAKSVVRRPQVQTGLSTLFRENRRGLRQLWFSQTHALGPNDIGLLFPGHLGDTYFACSLTGALQARHGGAQIVAFVKPSQRHIPALFPGIRRVVEVADVDTMWQVGTLKVSKGAQFWTLPEEHLGALLGFKEITILDLNRAWMGLPLDAPLTAPHHPSADEAARAAALLEAHGLPPGRTVLLAPESNTAPEYSLDAWAALAAALSQAGWTPVTNGGPKGYVIPGTARVDIPLDVCIAFVEQAGWLVTMRTGLADVVSSARARLTVFYPPTPDGFAGATFDGGVTARWYDAFSLVRMGLASHADEHEVGEADFAALIPEIVGGASALAPR